MSKPDQPTEPTVPALSDADAVQRAAPNIIAVFDAHPDLFLAACANPVLAMRDAGIEMTPEAERHVALRCRFSPEETKRLEGLASQISDHLGQVDLDDDAAVHARLRELGVDTKDATIIEQRSPSTPKEQGERVSSDPAITTATTDPKGTGTTRATKTPPRRDRALHPGRRSALAAAATLPQVQRWRQQRVGGPDPLEQLADAHPVMKPLLEYRKLSSTVPRFADAGTYARLAATKGGQLSEGINITLRVRLNRDD